MDVRRVEEGSHILQIVFMKEKGYGRDVVRHFLQDEMELPGRNLFQLCSKKRHDRILVLLFNGQADDRMVFHGFKALEQRGEDLEDLLVF